MAAYTLRNMVELILFIEILGLDFVGDDVVLRRGREGCLRELCNDTT